jgi:hypothetical protein
LQKTRVVRLQTGKHREQAPNSATVVLDVAAVVPERPFRELFLEHYPRIRELVEDYTRPGVAMVAIDDTGVAGTACLAAKPGRINAAIVGRHGMTDLYLESDPALSLRHLVVVIHPLQAREDVRFRVLDLRTTTSFFDERGRRLEALEAEGPVFIRCGRHTIFLIPTEESPTAWPDDPEAGWQCIPERVFLDDAPAEPDRWFRRRVRGLWGPAIEEREGARRRTLVQTSRGPSRASRRLLAEDDEALGELQIFSADGQSTIVVGKRTMREGILFGRYERCDNEGLPVLSNPRISRVHLLLVEIAGVVYAIDTASINGVYRNEEEVRLTPLQLGETLRLGDKLATIHWRTAR